MKNQLIKNPTRALTLILAFFSSTLMLCAQTVNTTANSAKIEVVYFHAPNRCPACVANETQTKQVLDKHFKNELSKGFISFISLDLKEASNNAIIEKYEIVFPTLLILKKQGKNEIKTDFTNTAFDYAFTEPEKYETLLQAEILRQLNSN